MLALLFGGGGCSGGGGDNCQGCSRVATRLVDRARKFTKTRGLSWVWQEGFRYLTSRVGSGHDIFNI